MQDFIGECQSWEDTDVRTIGQSLDGRDIDCLTMGVGDRVVWIIARQHPGESQAEFCCEALVRALHEGGEDLLLEDN